MPTLAYWDFRGLVQDIRLLLKYLNIDYEDKRYPPGPNFNDDHWLQEKFQLGLDFPNLPYFIDDDGTRLTESRAILRHIARVKCPILIPANLHEQSKADMLEGVLSDLQRQLVSFLYSKDHPEPTQLFETKLRHLADFIGDSQFSLGDQLYYIDFHLYEVLYQFFKFKSAFASKFPALNKFVINFENIEEISSYIKSPTVRQAVCYSRKGRFGFYRSQASDNSSLMSRRVPLNECSPTCQNGSLDRHKYHHNHKRQLDMRKLY